MNSPTNYRQKNHQTNSPSPSSISHPPHSMNQTTLLVYDKYSQIAQLEFISNRLITERSTSLRRLHGIISQPTKSYLLLHKQLKSRSSTLQLHLLQRLHQMLQVVRLRIHAISTANSINELGNPNERLVDRFTPKTDASFTFQSHLESPSIMVRRRNAWDEYPVVCHGDAECHHITWVSANGRRIL